MLKKLRMYRGAEIRPYRGETLRSDGWWGALDSHPTSKNFVVGFPLPQSPIYSFGLHGKRIRGQEAIQRTHEPYGPKRSDVYIMEFRGVGSFRRNPYYGRPSIFGYGDTPEEAVLNARSILEEIHLAGKHWIEPEAPTRRQRGRYGRELELVPKNHMAGPDEHERQLMEEIREQGGVMKLGALNIASHAPEEIHPTLAARAKKVRSCLKRIRTAFTNPPDDF